MIQCQVRKLSEDAKLPEYATDGSGCFDIYAYIGSKYKQQQVGGSMTFNTGLAFEIPEGHVMLVYSRSGHAFKKNMRLANCVAVIDSDYRGELLIKLRRDIHPEDETVIINQGDAIAQGMIIPIPKVEFLEVKELSETLRGEGGFGSTDKQAELGDGRFNWGLSQEQQGKQS